EADANAMVAWVNERLEVRWCERMNKLSYELAEQGNTFDFETGRSTPPEYYGYKTAINDAKAGDVEPLRKLLRKAGLPELADLTRSPERGPGGYRRAPNTLVEWAVEDAHYIRHELWPQEYGFKRRSRDNHPSAESIAAAFHNVDVEKVISQSRHS